MSRMMQGMVTVSILGLAAVHAPPAVAAVPFFNGTCPGGIDVHADDGGPVYVQGREAALKRFSDSYFEARDSDSGITLSITTNEDDVQMSYTDRSGANGLCNVSESSVRTGDSGAHPLPW